MSFVGDTVKHKSTTTNFNPSISPSPTPTPTASVTSSAADYSLCEVLLSEVEDNESVVIESDAGPSHPPVRHPQKEQPRKRKREPELDTVEKTLMTRLEQLQKPQQKDEAAAFGNHVAARLRTFSPKQYAMACLEIENVLVNTQFPPQL